MNDSSSEKSSAVGVSDSKSDFSLLVADQQSAKSAATQRRCLLLQQACKVRVDIHMDKSIWLATHTTPPPKSTFPHYG
ncbi:MAG: hypothetical protein A2632_02255 [Candidatus Pacebacteria bacterium RIFCSPHIGHO2_01_FULL_46_16]|nr:MAG: hypothetical protein A2632_02255 [Candidatus Pacebacteria bacterium RIFCSPHIGHO2_01_FULL_46_16]OGJ21205.1 MAG: hypothetical protein A3J60_00080 [Candidatus Pacebacteria bacterium RIFCSPHIGHO2_02_FULL_46_9]OGJ38208.1 MAG: hypothetical protein A3A82_01215 [Candidatus Pacebacteria bacterium RIFCSPLOWO2_01_FULL_47_12]